MNSKDTNRAHKNKQIQNMGLVMEYSCTRVTVKQSRYATCVHIKQWNNKIQ